MKRDRGYQIALNVVMVLIAFLCVFPFYLIVMSSFTSNTALVRQGYTIWPKAWSLDAYAYLVNRSGTILRAYGVTVLITVIGTLINLTVTTLLAYPLSRRDLPGRNALCFVVFFTMLFNGGLVPTYIWYTNILGLKNTIWGLIIPGLMMKAYYVILIRTFITNNVPTALIESAQIDGATEFTLFRRIVLPMCRPIIATVLLFVTIDYWNDWYNGMIYVTDSSLYSIQNFLTRLLNDIAYLQSSANATGDAAAALAKMPTVSVRLAIAIVGILPIMIAYPFIQKNFVKGIAIGSVKG